MIEWSSQEATGFFNKTSSEIEDTVVAFVDCEGGSVNIAFKPLDDDVYVMMIKGDNNWLDEFTPSVNIARASSFNQFFGMCYTFWPNDESVLRLKKLLEEYQEERS
jgi:hypothetical protein